MDIFDGAGLLLLAAMAWLWLDSLKAREAAMTAARSACNGEALLLLDDTVAIAGIRLARDGDGVLRLRRLYAFEYSDTGHDRSQGSIAMVGSRVLTITLNRAETPPQTPIH